MPDHSQVRAAVVQFMDTLRELEGAQALDRQLALLAALEGQADTLRGHARVRRRELSPPTESSFRGRIRTWCERHRVFTIKLRRSANGTEVLVAVRMAS